MQGKHVTDNISGEFNPDSVGESILGSLEVQFQPISTLDGDAPEVVGFEALGRIVGDVNDAKSISPFLKEIHDGGFGSELELLTVGQVCSFLRLCDTNLDQEVSDKLYVTVNLHHRALSDPDLVSQIESIIQSYPAARSRIRFEILEDAFPQDNYRQIMNNIGELSFTGYKIYMDDYGDNSDFDDIRLQEINPFLHGVKLSGSFLDRHQQEQDRMLDRIASSLLGKAVIVEGVETDGHMERFHLIKARCSESDVLAQGWHPDLGASMRGKQAVIHLASGRAAYGILVPDM